MYGKTDRYLLSVNAVLRAMKYWLRILQMDSSIFPCNVYAIMFHTSDYENWASKIEELPEMNSFEHIWRKQTARNGSQF